MNEDFPRCPLCDEPIDYCPGHGDNAESAEMCLLAGATPDARARYHEIRSEGAKWVPDPAYAQVWGLVAETPTGPVTFAVVYLEWMDYEINELLWAGDPDPATED